MLDRSCERENDTGKPFSPKDRFDGLMIEFVVCHDERYAIPKLSLKLSNYIRRLIA